MYIWRAKPEVEGTPNEPTNFFPFSKPSPFSSMTDWPFGTPTNDDRALQVTLPKENPNMSKDNVQRHRVLEEVAKFQKNMEELRLLRIVSNDLRSYRRMIRIKRND